jgi:hypothetical protein
MPNVRRRLETLERAVAPKHDTDADQLIFKQVLHHLSIEQLELLRGIAVDYQQGRLRLGCHPTPVTKRVSEARDLTPGESAAMAAYTSAFEQEIQSAGFSSLAEFERRYWRR